MKYVATGGGDKHLHNTEQCPILTRMDGINTREASGQEQEILPECTYCHEKLVRCRYCREQYTIQGVGSHENFCDDNPDRIGGSTHPTVTRG